MNFGRASADIERAKKALEVADGLLDVANRTDAATALHEAMTRATEAQRLAGNVDQTANARVAEALNALARVDAAPGK